MRARCAVGVPARIGRAAGRFTVVAARRDGQGDTAGLARCHSDEPACAPSEREMSPVERDLSHDERELSPVERDIAPDERDIAPDERETSHDERETSPDVRETSPVERETSPDVRDIAPVERETSHDVRDVSHDVRDIPHDERDISHDERDIPHDERDISHDERDISHDERDLSHVERETSHVERDLSHVERETSPDERDIAPAMSALAPSNKGESRQLVTRYALMTKLPRDLPAADAPASASPEHVGPLAPRIRGGGAANHRKRPDPPRDPVAEAYRLFSRDLLRRFRGKGVGPESASGLVQEVFLNTHTVVAEDGIPASFPKMLSRIARFVLANYWRTRRRRPICDDVDDAEIPASQPDAEQQVGRAEAARKIELLLGRLPAPMAEVIRLIDLDGKTPEEVGAMLGHPATTIRSRHTRALARLGEAAVDLQMVAKPHTK